MSRQFLLIFIISLALATPVSSKDIVLEAAEAGLQVRQQPHTEAFLQSFFNQLPQSVDTLYATIFRPAHCPRCEATITKTHTLLKEHTPHPTVLISVYPDSAIAKKYNSTHSFQADYHIYDTDERFADFLSFDCGHLHIPYLLKISRNAGRLIVGMTEDYATSSFIKALSGFNTQLDYASFPKAQPITPSSEYQTMLKETGRRRFVNIPPEEIVSEVMYSPLLTDGHLYFNDKLAMTIYHLQDSADVMTFRNRIEADKSEQTEFVDIPEHHYQGLLKRDEVKFIPLQPFRYDSTHIAVSYSLPRLWMEDSTSIAYMNEACFIVRGMDGLSGRSIKQALPDTDDDFFYTHFYLKKLKDKLIVNCERLTGPAVYEKDEYAGSPEMDQFVDSFYDDFRQPVLASVNLGDGKIHQQFGKLPFFARTAKTGYSFSNAVFDTRGDEIAYASPYSGEIFISTYDTLDCDDCARKYSAFNIPAESIIAPDPSLYYTFNCEHQVKSSLRKQIVDLKFNSSDIFLLIRDGQTNIGRPFATDYLCVIISRLTGDVATYRFPAGKETGLRTIGYGIGEDNDNEMFPYMIAMDEADCFLVTFKP